MQWQLPSTGFAHALVIEDDPVTGEFLVDALRGAGWNVVLATGVVAALQLARERMPELLLCDVRLGDGDAFDVAHALLPEGEPQAARRPHAAALSAELGDDLRARLHAAGYGIVLTKPLPISVLLAALPAPGQPLPRCGEYTLDPVLAATARELPVLDDAAALSVCGSMGVVDALRALLASDLGRTLHGIDSALGSGDTNSLQDQLHRLRASCGFCGAAELGAAVARVRFDADSPDERAVAVAQLLTAGHALLRRLELRPDVDDRRGTQQ